MKLEKDVNEKNNLITNLREEKNILLEMRNVESSPSNPEMENLKNQILES